MRVFAAGLSAETNTFSPIPCLLESFALLRPDECDSANAGLFTVFDLFRDQCLAKGHDYIFGMAALAQPAGITDRSAYEALRDEILERLSRALPCDVVLLWLHGAMVAHGYDDCEADLLGRVRSMVGEECTIGVELDLHANLTADTIADADIVVAFKEYPHTDMMDRAQEVLDLSLRTAAGEIAPTTAIIDCEMVGVYPTTSPAMRRIVSRMASLEAQRGVLSVSFFHGFPWSDLPFTGAKVIVTTDNDAKLAESIAEDFAFELLAARRSIELHCVPLELALYSALTSQRSPVIVVDVADNPGGGAPGDSTFALKWLIENGAQDVALGIFYDPQVVEAAQSATIGSEINIHLGGKHGAISGEPVAMKATVLGVRTQYRHAFPQTSGSPVLVPMGAVAGLRCGTIDVVVNSLRGQCLSPSIFSDLSIDLAPKRTVIVKSAQHFYAAFAPIAARTIYMTSPGALATNVTEIPYQRLNTRAMYPWKQQ